MLGAMAIMVGVAAPVQAQAPAVTASGGWNYIHISEEDEDDLQNLPAGWYADLAVRVAGPVSVAGQVFGNYKEVDEVNFSLLGFAGGLRLTMPGSANPFVQALFGTARSKFSFLDLEESEDDNFLQVGVGADFAGGGPVGLRVGADYIRALTEGEGTNVFRVGLGISFGR